MKPEQNVTTTSGDNTESPALTSPVERYVPLTIWAVAILVLFLIALKIASYGYLPGGDTRRHVAKAFTDKPYTEIVVMRPGYTVDNSPGWEWILTKLHRVGGLGKDALVSFSIISLLLCFFIAPLPWLRRPEAWLLALLTLFITRTSLLGHRLSQGRPLVLTEAILIAILFAWSRPNTDRPSVLKIILTCIAFTLTVWIHGAWYLWGVPLAAFFFAGAWRSGLWLSACFGIGAIVGASLSGNPLGLLGTALANLSAIFYNENTPQWMLVGELAPDTGDFAVLIAMALLFLTNRLAQRKSTAEASGIWLRPVVTLMLVCWILGFKVDRFWADWGLPAALIWIALQFQNLLENLCIIPGMKRVALVGLVAIPLYLVATNDTDRRYTFNLSQPFLSAEDPALKGWFPGHNGIFYSTQMDLFYDTFYTNPNGDWRYILGFEPALMPDDDLKIFRRIVWNHESSESYQPWIDKMHPEDRLAIYANSRPNLPQLEWHRAAEYIWIGRLPR